MSTDAEFLRYAAVISDPCTPVEQLIVRTNDACNIPFLQSLMEKYSLPGAVELVP